LATTKWAPRLDRNVVSREEWAAARAILDRAPNGRDEGEGVQLWIRRDEYGAPDGAEGAATDGAAGL
jgi:hypothetical protein